MKKTFAMLIAMLLVLATLLCSCNGDKGEEQTQPPQDTGEETLPGPPSKVPADLKFSNQEVTVLLPAHAKEEFDADNSTAVIDKAIMDRNEAVEGRLEIELTYLPRDEANTGAYQGVIRNSILGGGDSYDIVTGNAYYTAALAAEGLFYDFNTVADDNYVSTDLVWYNQSFVKDTAYKNQLYFLTGDLTISIYDRTPVVFFNEDELDRWQIEENLYNVALEGNWTIEYLQTLVQNVEENLDGLDEKTKDDYYGLFFNGGSMNIDAMLTSVGIRLATIQEDGSVKISWTDGTASDAFAKIYQLMYESTGVYTGTVAKGTYYGEATNYYSEQAFFERRSIFSFGMLNAAKTFALTPDLHYGILPLPKYDAAKPYATTPQDAHSVVALPRNLGNNLGRSTAVLETLSQQSYLILRPVYHETAYKVRYASSAETGKLFDTVIESVTFDFGTFYSNSLQNATHKLRNRLSGEGTAASSSLTGVTIMYTRQVQGKLDELLEKFDTMEVPPAA